MNNLFELKDRTILVTGGTRGIGRAISLQLARAGATVLANFVRNEKTAAELIEVAEAEGLQIRLCRADLATEKGIETLEQAIADNGGVLHGFVHCAATGVHKPFAELTLRHYDWTFNLNVRAFFQLMNRLLPRFASSASVVTISSQGALRAVPSYSVVGASKGALEALARHLAVELAPRGIRVNIIAPGAVATEAWSSMPDAEARLAELTRRTPSGRLVSPEDVAVAAQFLVSDAARAIVGQTLVVDGGAAIPV